MIYFRSRKRSASRGSSYLSELSDMACRGSTHSLHCSSIFGDDDKKERYLKRRFPKTHEPLPSWSRSRAWDERLRDCRSRDRYYYGEDEYPPLLDKTDTYDGYFRSRGLTMGLEEYEEDDDYDSDSDYDYIDCGYEDDLQLGSYLGRRRDPYYTPHCTRELELYRQQAAATKKEKERKYTFMTDFGLPETDLPPSSKLYQKLYGSKWRWKPANDDEGYNLRRDYYDETELSPSNDRVYHGGTEKCGPSEYRLLYETGLPKTSATHEKLYGYRRNWFTLSDS